MKWITTYRHSAPCLSHGGHFVPLDNLLMSSISECSGPKQIAKETSYESEFGGVSRPAVAVAAQPLDSTLGTAGVAGSSPVKVSYISSHTPDT